jgi:hypothetical protein
MMETAGCRTHANAELANGFTKSARQFVMRGLDPRIHPLQKSLSKKDGLPGQARQ